MICLLLPCLRAPVALLSCLPDEAQEAEDDAVNQHGIYRRVTATDRVDLSAQDAPEIETIAQNGILSVIYKTSPPSVSV